MTMGLLFPKMALHWPLVFSASWRSNVLVKASYSANLMSLGLLMVCEGTVIWGFDLKASTLFCAGNF